MAQPGDAAAAAGMATLTGNELARTLATETNITRDYIAERTSAITPVESGGTGAATPEAARTNLALVGTAELAPANSAQPNKIPKYNAAAQLTTASPTLNGHAASKQYVDNQVSQKAEADLVANILAGELGSAVWNRDIASTRRSVWMSAPAAGYIDLGWASSSRTKKENIEDANTTDDQVLDARLVSFDRIGGGHELGGIAEEFEEAGFGWLVYRDEEGNVEGIEYSMLGIALWPVVQRLIRRVAQLESPPATSEAA